jgi:hypothetical protein
MAVMAALTLWGANRIRQIEARPFRIRDLVDSFQVMLMVFFINDSLWLAMTGIRWLPFHPDSLLQVSVAMIRNVSVMIILWILIFRVRYQPHLDFGIPFISRIYIETCFLLAWFTLAPSPAWTDYTYAINAGASLQQVLVTYLISHVVAKVFWVQPFFIAWIDEKVDRKIEI